MAGTRRVRVVVWLLANLAANTVLVAGIMRLLHGGLAWPLLVTGGILTLFCMVKLARPGTLMRPRS